MGIIFLGLIGIGMVGASYAISQIQNVIIEEKVFRQKLRTSLLIYYCRKTKPILIGNVYHPPDQYEFIAK